MITKQPLFFVCNVTVNDTHMKHQLITIHTVAVAFESKEFLLLSFLSIVIRSAAWQNGSMNKQATKQSRSSLVKNST